MDKFVTVAKKRKVDDNVPENPNLVENSAQPSSVLQKTRKSKPKSANRNYKYFVIENNGKRFA